MRACKFLSLVLAALLLPLSGVSSAAFTTFTDFASFDAATDTTLVEDFEALATGLYAPSLTSNGITYTGLQDIPNVFVAAAGFTNFGVPVTPSQVLTANGNEVFEIDLSAVAATAVGFDAYLNDPSVYGPVTTEYFGAADNLLATVIDSRGPGAPFLGVLADEPIYRITWTAVGGDRVNTGIDNLRLGQAAPTPTIPAPGAILLGTLGTGLVGWLRRRRTL